MMVSNKYLFGKVFAAAFLFLEQYQNINMFLSMIQISFGFVSEMVLVLYIQRDKI